MYQPLRYQLPPNEALMSWLILRSVASVGDAADG
jgi:hypothetical protein